MNILDPIFIVVLIFGLHTSYTDIKHGKIKNICILFLLISGLLLNIFLTKTFSTIDFDLKSDFIQSIINVIIAFSFGFFLWSAGLWPSGDAKLFLGYSVLLPVFTYKYGYISFFPSLTVLINTFVPLAVFYIINSLFYVDPQKMKANIKQTFLPKNVIILILYVFGLFYILELVLNYFNITLNFVLQMIIIFALMEILSKISSKATLIFSICGSMLRILFSPSPIFTLSFLSQLLLTAIVFLILKLLLNITEFYSKSVNITNLKGGMTLNEQLIRTKKGIVKKESSLITIFDIFQSLKDGFTGDVKTRLTEEDVKELQRLRKKGELEFDEIKIAKTVPFAPFMFLGVLLTFLLEGSLFYYINLILS